MNIATMKLGQREFVRFKNTVIAIDEITCIDLCYEDEDNDDTVSAAIWIRNNDEPIVFSDEADVSNIGKFFGAK